MFLMCWTTIYNMSVMHKIKCLEGCDVLYDNLQLVCNAQKVLMFLMCWTTISNLSVMHKIKCLEVSDALNDNLQLFCNTDMLKDSLQLLRIHVT